MKLYSDVIDIFINFCLYCLFIFLHRQLMAGVDVLKLMAETLACIDRITEEKDKTSKEKDQGYGTSL